MNHLRFKPKFLTGLVGMILICIFTSFYSKSSHSTVKAPIYTWLALGDSYTIGENVSIEESFPFQAVGLLRKEGFNFDSPEIIAKTGWTTDELLDEISSTIPLSKYDFVTLLIGVNNQYRGKSVEDYRPEFDSLLKYAIMCSGERPDHVIVLSIPDWGLTPFAVGRDKGQISREIDAYNEANKSIAKKYKAQYIDITRTTREAPDNLSFMAPDGLHYSGKEYAKWALKVSDAIRASLNKSIIP